MYRRYRLLIRPDQFTGVTRDTLLFPATRPLKPESPLAINEASGRWLWVSQSSLCRDASAKQGDLFSSQPKTVARSLLTEG